MRTNSVKGYDKAGIYHAVKRVSNELLHQHKMKVTITKTPASEIDSFFEGNDKYMAKIDIMKQAKHETVPACAFVKEEDNPIENKGLGDFDLAVSGKTKKDALLNLLNYLSSKIINVEGFKEKGQAVAQTRIFKMPDFHHLKQNSKIRQLAPTKNKGVWEVVSE